MPATIINIDQNNWPRKSHYEVYSSIAKCYSHITVQVDVTRVKHYCAIHNQKFYAIMILLVSEVINQIPELRMTLDENQKPAFWSYTSPSYTVFHEEDKTFSTICTKFTSDRKIFYNALLHDMENAKKQRGIAIGTQYQNNFHISCLPWLHFDSFSLDLVNGLYLTPIITWGKYEKKHARLMMPMAMTVHHAAADYIAPIETCVKLRECQKGVSDEYQETMDGQGKTGNRASRAERRL